MRTFNLFSYMPRMFQGYCHQHVVILLFIIIISILHYIIIIKTRMSKWTAPIHCLQTTSRATWWSHLLVDSYFPSSRHRRHRRL